MVSKYLKAFITALVIILCGSFLDSSTANASIGEAQPINVNTAIRGSLTSDYGNGSEKFYKFTASSDGNLTFSISQKTNTSWAAYILNAKGETLQQIQTDSSDTANGKAIAQVGLAKGTYYIKIEASYAEGETFEFMVGFTPSNYYEKEFNDSYATANNIKVNTGYKGVIQNYSDADFYKVTLPSNGNVVLSIKQKTGVQWNGYILDQNGNTLDYLNTDDSDLANGNAYAKVGLPKGTYYIKITGAFEQDEYNFSVNLTNSNFYEREFNDSIATSNSMVTNSTYKGYIQQYYDKDFYSFKVPSSRTVKLTVKQKANSSWYYSIHNANGKEYINYDTETSDTAATYKTLSVYLPKGTYYVRVSGAFSKELYEFKLFSVSSSPKKNQIKVANNKGKSDTVRLNGLVKGDIVKVYHSASSRKPMVTKAATKSTVTVSLKQLGQKTGKVYITITKRGMSESAKTAVVYSGEQSDALKSKYVKISNNKKKSDTITVFKVKKGDTIKIYSSKGKLLSRKVSPGSKAKISVKQLGKKSGKVYVTVTKSGQKESSKTAVKFYSEKK